MATTVFEKITITSSDNASVKSKSTPKNNFGNFKELVKEKKPTKFSDEPKKVVVTQSSGRTNDTNKKSNDLIKAKQQVQEHEVGVLEVAAQSSNEIVETSMIPMPTTEQLVSDELSEEVLEEVVVDNEKEEGLTDEQLVVDESYVSPFIMTEQPIVSINLGNSEAVISEKSELVDGSIAVASEVNLGKSADSEIEFNVQSSVISNQSPEDQALFQHMKTLKLPEGFKPVLTEIELKTNITTFQQGDIQQQDDNSINDLAKSNLEEMLRGLKANVTEQKENVSLDSERQRAVLASSNMVLADNTKSGQKVLSRLHQQSQTNIEPNNAAVENQELTVFEEVLTNLGDDSRNKSSSSQMREVFSSFGGIVDKHSEDLTQISFRDHLAGNEKKPEIPKPVMQVSLAVNEALKFGNVGDKRIVTINMFPDVLGPVKVEILSVAAEDGARKVQNIKIIAEKRETLEILEKSRIDLEKSLKEVTSSKEEASLEFEMNQGSNGQKGEYFETLDERINWMNKFADISGEEDSSEHQELGVQHQNEGYITEDSVNIEV